VGPRSRLPWDGPDTTFDLGLIVTFESRDAAIAYIPHPTHLQAIAASDRVAERVQAFYFNG
jgi:hypothetical protein